MKGIILSAFLISFVFVINSCALFGGFAVMGTANNIDKSVLSEKNRNFQDATGINLTYVKRAMWSMQDQHKNKMMKLYFESLLENKLVFSDDILQGEFAKQVINNDEIEIIINSNYLQNYSELEKAILLAALSTTLAITRDASYGNTKNLNTFYKSIESYEGQNVNITGSQWYKEKKIIIADDKVVFI